MKKNIFFRSLILISMLLLTRQLAVAQFEEGKELIIFGLPALNGTGIVATATNTTTWASASEVSKKITNIITFKISEGINAYLETGFTATVYFKIDSKTTLGSSPVQTSRTLTVNYDTAAGSKYNVRAYLILPEAEEIKITVDSIHITGYTGSYDPINVLQLENEMRILRYYTLSSNPTYLQPTFNSPEIDTSSVQVSWVWDDSTKHNMTQLEWAWVEDEMAGFYPSHDSLFEINSSRVDLDFVQNSYQIPLLYDGEGKLYYRVRAVQRKNDGSVITGPWSDADSLSFDGHEPDMNWQSSTSFAENGKFKSVIQYFDGSLRSRQTVTKDNSTGNTVVAETVYDMQGRPNMQILPTPTIGNTIKYFKDFNRFLGQTSNDNPAKYFDLTPAAVACNRAVSLDSNYGNGKYYSNLNPWIGIEENASFVPDAQGYAFTETRFTDDATQRVKAQGGVGIKHQIGSGHETIYYYGKPTQQELDALFATEVGDASHYSKNMVRDANGQMSVSYVDMHGRTIATALAGDSTSGMTGIAADTTDYPLASGTLTNKLSTPLTNVINGNSIESISTILVPATTIYNFTYKLDPSILSQFACNSTEICFDCKYDLEISIKSEECVDTTIIRRYNNLQVIPAMYACDSSRGFTGESVSNAKEINFSETLGIGSWIVRKTLTVNDSMFQVRKDSALKVFLCKTEQSIYDSVYAVLYTTSGCGISQDSTAIVACDSCNANLGTFNTYRYRYLIGIGADTLDNSYDEAIHFQYAQDSLECANICGALNVELTTLQSLRKQMLSHMMPFTGQYAIDSIRNDSTGLATPLTTGMLQSKYNIFTTIRPFDLYTKPLYKYPRNENTQLFYYTEDMQVDSIIHRHDENNDPILDTISREGFSSLFQQSWAKSLIKYHPEYPSLLVAEGALRPTYEWLDSMQAIDDYATAYTNGFTNPLSLPSASAHPDPFYQMSGNSLYKDTMDARIREGMYIIAGPTGPTGTEASIWQVANSTVLCEGVDSASKEACILSLTADGLDPAITLTASKNRVWEVFRGLYQGYRNEMVLKYIYAQTGVLTRLEMDSLLDEGKQLVFANQQDVATQNHAGGWWGMAVSGDTTGLDSVRISILNTMADKCEGQKPFWRARLLQCEALIDLLNNETSGDSITVNNIIDSILVGMVSVCNNSRDARHLYGASNVKPTYMGVPRDFEAVINYVLNDNGIDTAGLDGYFCNPYTIDFPKPYGKNPPLLTNYSNKIDTCGCIRFAELKAEAHSLSYDTTSFTSINTFLKVHYADSLTLVVWNGLQYCDSLYTDSCTAGGYIVANDYPYAPVRDTTYDSLPPDCGEIYFRNIEYVNNTSADNVLVEYFTPEDSYCLLHVFDAFDHFYASYLITCGTNDIYLSLPPCTTYKFLLQSYTEEKECNTFSDTLLLLPGEYCGECSAPEIESVSIIPPNPTSTTQNVTVGYAVPTGATNCNLYVYARNYPSTPLYSIPLDCDSTSVTIEIDACYKYRFQVRCDVDSVCLQKPSNSVFLDSCSTQQCHRTYSTIYLPEVAVIPPFLNCDYVKPCITCEQLTELTEEFRDRFPAYSTVPYTDSLITEAQGRQNSLWARFLNYRTGFSKNAYDYLEAYINCDTVSTPPTYAICSFSPPANDPGGIFEIDTIPCRNVQTQAEFIAQMLYQKMKDSLIANFDSLYKAKCFAAKDQEQFYATYQPKEYHYTLYYYDQTGNLVKTIPPAGVKPDFDSVYLVSVESARLAGTEVSSNNNDSLATFYRYNTLNQVIAQRTPDAGISKFWYDRLGRLAVSQNAKQKLLNQYSYTLYDELGRITEVGQSTNDSVMTQAISQDTAALATWIADVTADIKKQITLTVYDIPYTNIAVTYNNISGLYQQNLRNRVSYSMVFDDEDQKVFYNDGTIGGGNSATYYSYDIHGNVDTLLQDYKTGMGTEGCDTTKHNRYKKMVYYYDLISGKVNDVAFQQGEADQFFHRYVYDAENRITSVKTSRDKIFWEQDAEYSYYRHGPLSRTVLGHNQVQGLDYAYTIQGWLKGVNSTSVDTALYDIGLDGNTSSLNNMVARDAFGFSLNYFTGDYKPVNAAKTPFSTLAMNLPADPVSGISTGHQLFNGNIGAMAVNITKFNNPLVYGYRYDQLNRIVRMDAFDGLDNADNTFTANRLNDYHEEVTYDPNGNIRTYLRNATTAGSGPLGMDNLAYTYTANTNKLKRVTDAVSSGNYTEDIDNQSNSENYIYDAIGNLIEDKAEGIDSIHWTVYGKIKRIVKGGTTINYTYDAAGNRISKAVTASAVTKTTYYVRDASGNVMSIYQAGDNTINSGDLTQTEVHLYGSSRLGIYNVNNNVLCAPDSTDLTIFTRGNKFFELSNHLGNVLVSISDKKIVVPEYVCGFAGCELMFHHYEADVVTANDYYPFGMNQPGRKYTNGSGYRYGFNGKENDNEVKGAGNSIHFEFREYDPRLGKFTSIDPIANNYPWQSPYAFAANSPISLVDVLGMGPGDPRNHTVAKGDNLTKIAKKYGVTVDDLLKMNKIKDKNKISIGQNLIVNPEADFSNNPRGGYQNPQNSFGPELKVNNIAQIGLDFVFGKGTENTVVVSGGALRSVQNWNVVQSMVQSGVGRLKYNGKPGDYTVMNYRPGNLPTNIKRGLSEAFESITRGEDPWKNNSQNSPIHVLGSFNMTIRINANGTTATVCIYDSKTFSSFSDNNAGSESNKARGKSDNKYLTNTYQRYLWNVNLFNGLPIEYTPPVTITSGRN